VRELSRRAAAAGTAGTAGVAARAAAQPACRAAVCDRQVKQAARAGLRAAWSDVPRPDGRPGCGHKGGQLVAVGCSRAGCNKRGALNGVTVVCFCLRGPCMPGKPLPFGWSLEQPCWARCPAGCGAAAWLQCRSATALDGGSAVSHSLAHPAFEDSSGQGVWGLVVRAYSFAIAQETRRLAKHPALAV